MAVEDLTQIRLYEIKHKNSVPPPPHRSLIINVHQHYSKFKSKLQQKLF